MTEAEVQAAAIAALREAGARVTYHTHDARRSDEGFPDLTAPVAGQIWAIECKASTGRLTAAQVLWANEWARHGGRWFLVTPETLAQLREQLGLPPQTAIATETGGKAREAPLRIDPDDAREVEIHQIIHELGFTRARAEAIVAHNARREG
jgi:hypothetical protein